MNWLAAKGETPMYKVIYTKTRDYASEIEAESIDFDSMDLAIAKFNELVKTYVNEILSNEFLRSNLNVYNHKALIKIEGTHYCIAIKKG